VALISAEKCAYHVVAELGRVHREQEAKIERVHRPAVAGRAAASDAEVLASAEQFAQHVADKLGHAIQEYSAKIQRIKRTVVEVKTMRREAHEIHYMGSLQAEMQSPQS